MAVCPPVAVCPPMAVRPPVSVGKPLSGSLQPPSEDTFLGVNVWTGAFRYGDLEG